MAKGAVIDETFLSAVGLAEQIFTLAGPMDNQHHPVLQEPMFRVRIREIGETAWLERKYVFDNQISIRSNYGDGQKVLAWLQRAQRPDPRDPGKSVEVLLARDLFLFQDWREFQRFKNFVKSMRIIDAQARQWLSDHHAEFAGLAAAAEGVDRVLDCLGAIREWPDLEGGPAAGAGSLEAIAKAYSPDLARIRAAPALGPCLLARAPDVRFAVFRLLSFVEDPQGGAASVVRFIQALARASGDAELAAAALGIKSSRDLARALGALRQWLLSPKRPPAPAA